MEDLSEYFEQMELSLSEIECHKESEQLDLCVSCGSNALCIDSKNGTIVCSSCGVVNLTDMIDDTAEWNYGPEEGSGNDPSRCGCPINPLLEKSSMSTMIGKGGGNKFWLMKKIHQQNSMDYVERARWHVFENITRMCETANLPSSVVSHAKQFYKIISEKKLSRGSVRQGLIACCIMFACREYKVSRSVKEIAAMCNIEASKINSATKIFQELLSNELNTSNNNNATNESDLILRFCCKLDLDYQDQFKLAKEVRKHHEKIDETGILVGKTPSAVTSSLIYICAQKQNINLNKKELSALHSVSVVTLNKIINIIESHGLS